MTVRQLLESIDSRELSEWMAFYGLEPFGVEVDDLMHAHVCQVLAAVNTGKGKEPKLDKFLLFPDTPAKRKQSPEEMHARLRAMTAVITNAQRS